MATAHAAAAPPLPEWTVTARCDFAGETLTVRRTGTAEGPALVLAHGMEGHHEEWGPLAATLVDRYPVYTLDLPWRAGGSHRWSQEADAVDYLRAALELVDEPVGGLVGHSYGANTVLRYLCQNADAPTSAAGPRVAGLIAPFYLPSRVEVTWQAFDRARAGFGDVIADGIRVRLGGRADRLDPDVWARMLDKVLDRIGPFGFFAFFRQYIATADLDLSGIAVPTVVLAGHDEELFTADRAEALAKAMPAAAVRFDSRFSHFSHITQVDLLAAELNGFLDLELPAAPPTFERE